MNKTLTAIAFLLLACATCLGQTSYKNLAPGKSTRVDVERVLGQPVKEHTQTLIEYRPDTATQSKIYVQYRKGSQIIALIQILLVTPRKRSDILTTLKLPERPTASRTNPAGNLEEYFASPFYVVLTYQGEANTNGITRTGRYSRELFDSAIASARESTQNQRTQSASPRSDSDAVQLTSADVPAYMRPPAGATSTAVDRSGRTSTSGASSCFPGEPGVANTTRSVHYDWAKQQSSGVLDSNLQNKLGLLFRCASISDEKLANAFANISVVVAKDVPNANCFNGDRGVISTDAPAHYNWARSKSREQMLNNLQGKVSSALRCLDRSAQLDLFADISVIIATSGP